MFDAKRLMELALAGTVAGVVIACGDSMLDASGAAMQDAGSWLSDAGASMAGSGADMGDPGSMMRMGGEMLQDAGAIMSDAGQRMGKDAGGDEAGLMGDAGGVLRDAGTLLSDAGAALRDGSSQLGPDGATAQSSCGSCTASNRQMVLIASEDPEQLLGGSLSQWVVTRSSTVSGFCSTDVEYRGYSLELGQGPLLVTDVMGQAGSVELYAVPSADSCLEVRPQAPPALYTCPGESTFLYLEELVDAPAARRRLLNVTSSTQLTGARILVAAGEKLCATAASFDLTPTTAAEQSPVRMLWSAFVPYP
ncbi:MAG: hypothetical protein OEZ06_32735 [Myxococcales bacterium]|nr:hypothetical protein [Myxococcales bacterium]